MGLFWQGANRTPEFHLFGPIRVGTEFLPSIPKQWLFGRDVDNSRCSSRFARHRPNPDSTLIRHLGNISTAASLCLKRGKVIEDNFLLC